MKRTLLCLLCLLPLVACSGSTTAPTDIAADNGIQPGDPITPSGQDAPGYRGDAPEPATHGEVPPFNGLRPE